MDEPIAALLADATVRRELRRAWLDSNPGAFGGHEEGGFICLSGDGAFVVDRWEAGEKAYIIAPPHPGGKRSGEWIVATFHTHPNTSRSFIAEPNEEDCSIVASDHALKTVYYVGEFVVAPQYIYLILPGGTYTTVAETAEDFAKEVYTMTSLVFQDPTVLAMGNAVVVAKEEARSHGHDISRQRISVRQVVEDDRSVYWHIEFAPIPPPGLTMRGGGYIVEVNDVDGSVRRSLFTQ